MFLCYIRLKWVLNSGAVPTLISSDISCFLWTFVDIDLKPEQSTGPIKTSSFPRFLSILRKSHNLYKLVFNCAFQHMHYINYTRISYS